MEPLYSNLKDLKMAFENGHHNEAEPKAFIDNDQVSIYIWDAAGGQNDQCFINLEPREALHQALQLLGIETSDA